LFFVFLDFLIKPRPAPDKNLPRCYSSRSETRNIKINYQKQAYHVFHTVIILFTLLLYGTNYFILSEVCTRLRLKSVAFMFFLVNSKLYHLFKNMSKLNVKSARKKIKQKSMSLPSIIETKNATLLRIRIVILAVHYTATSSPFCNSRPEAGGRHSQQTARPRHLIFSRVRCHGTRIL
jgi:hypothetical protein